MAKKKVNSYLTKREEGLFFTLWGMIVGLLQFVPKWVWKRKEEKIEFIKLSCGCIHNTEYDFTTCNHHRSMILGDELEKFSAI